MKDSKAYYIHLLWSILVIFSFPIGLDYVYRRVFGHASGYGFGSGAEGNTALVVGCIVLVVWVVMALPSIVYVFRKTAIKGRVPLLIVTTVYVALALICLANIFRA